jgi:hypothetical protein
MVAESEREVNYFRYAAEIYGHGGSILVYYIQHPLTYRLEANSMADQITAAANINWSEIDRRIIAAGREAISEGSAPLSWMREEAAKFGVDISGRCDALLEMAWLGNRFSGAR